MRQGRGKLQARPMTLCSRDANRLAEDEDEGMKVTVLGSVSENNGCTPIDGQAIKRSIDRVAEYPKPKAFFFFFFAVQGIPLTLCYVSIAFSASSTSIYRLSTKRSNVDLQGCQPHPSTQPKYCLNS